MAIKNSSKAHFREFLRIPFCGHPSMDLDHLCNLIFMYQEFSTFAFLRLEFDS
jgi:hypothetical protein